MATTCYFQIHTGPYILSGIPLWNPYENLLGHGIFHVHKPPPVAKGTTASTEAAMLYEQIRGLADGKGVEEAAGPL